MSKQEMFFDRYCVEPMRSKEAAKYIRENHYSKGCHNGPSPCYGLFLDERLVGVLLFATPCSENVRSSVFGKGHESRVTELHRLHILDEVDGEVLPKNTESWFISRCLKRLKKDKPQIWAVLSFADSTEGHAGTIYKATNALYCGESGRATFYLDETGRLRHPRQCGRNIGKDEAKEKGWTPVKRGAKHRYLYLLPDGRAHGRTLKRMSRYHETLSEKEHP